MMCWRWWRRGGCARKGCHPSWTLRRQPTAAPTIWKPCCPRSRRRWRMRGAIGGLSNTAALTTRNETTRHGTRYAARTRKSTSKQPSTQRRRWAVTDREEVQRLLSATVVAGYEAPDGDVTGVRVEVDETTLAEPCRSWL